MYSLNQDMSLSSYYGPTTPAVNSVTTEQQTWNGNKWVENPVALYTKYYHGWDAIAKQASRPADEKAWAKYNADLASYAAHYFYQNPSITQLPPGLKLPPVPPPSSAVTTTTKNSSQASPQPAISSANPPRSQKKTDSKSNGDGMKGYMNRCLEQAKTETDRMKITERIRQMIQEQLTKGVGLNTIDWEARPLISLSNSGTTPGCRQHVSVSLPSPKTFPKCTRGFSASSSPIVSAKTLNFTSSDSYYGPSRSDEQSKNKRRKQTTSSSPSSSSGSYFGPSNDFQQTTSDDYIAFSGGLSNKRKPASTKSKTWNKETIQKGFDQSTSKLNDRASRFSGQGGLTSKPKSNTNWDKYKGAATIGGSKKKLDERDYENMTVKGTCMILEKAYLRLTAPPIAEYVRPKPVLQQHLANLKAERKQSSGRDYLWLCSQFKAIRQDCTVQRIQDAFTVDVYETHARIALEEKDMNEFNQCQTQLIALYKHLTDPLALQNQDEFLGYRLMYQTFVAIVNGGGSSELLKTMLSVTHSQQHDDPIIRHALAVRRASSGGDYYGFFRLYKECPNIWVKYLMDGLVTAVRFNGLKCIAKSYRPSPVSVDFVLRQLGLHGEEMYGREWLTSCGCKISEDGTELLTNESEVQNSTMKKSLI